MASRHGILALPEVLIVVECVNDLSLAPIVMLGVAVSMAVNWSMNERGHDEEVIHRRELPFLEPEAPQSFDSKAALDLCIPCSPLPPEAPLHQILEALEEDASYFAVKEPSKSKLIDLILYFGNRNIRLPVTPAPCYLAQSSHMSFGVPLGFPPLFQAKHVLLLPSCWNLLVWGRRCCNQCILYICIKLQIPIPSWNYRNRIVIMYDRSALFL